MKIDACLSRKSDEWETPQWLFDKLNEEFNFTFDAAATRENSKCGGSYGDEIGNSLTLNWYYHAQKGNVWLNPPYSKISEFMEKAFTESCFNGCVVVCLIPSRTDTRWWHDYVMKAGKIIFIKGRLKFGNSSNSAPFPSCIVIFYNGLNTGFPEFSTMENKP
jgi:site-specific DNA-methyltransferase (adenine-specific)